MRALSQFSAILVLLVCGFTAATALAQDPSTPVTTDTLSDYTTPLPTTPPESTPTPTPTTTEPTATAEPDVGEDTSPTGDVAGDSGSGGNGETGAPAVAATPQETTPSTLAFTGATAWLLLLVGGALVGGALWLLRRERHPS